jgi:hypothetical protein
MRDRWRAISLNTSCGVGAIDVAVDTARVERLKIARICFADTPAALCEATYSAREVPRDFLRRLASPVEWTLPWF